MEGGIFLGKSGRGGKGMFKKIDNMKLAKKLSFGYIVVVVLMVLSFLLSMTGLAVLNNSLNDFVNGSNLADTAVKICRIDVNIAARNMLTFDSSNTLGL